MNNRRGYYFYGIGMVILNRYIILFSALLMAFSASAQSNSAGAAYYKALQYRLKHKDSLACVSMQKAITLDPTFTDAYSTLGAWYFLERKYEQATDVFVRASRNCRNGANAFALPLARTLLYNYKPGQAMQLIVSNAGISKNKEWQVLRQQAMFMQRAMASPLPDSVKNLGLRVNTRYPELYPFISADTMQLYFSRLVNNVDMDCYKATVDSCGGWFYARNIGAPINTIQHEAAQTVSADGHYMFYMRCENKSENGWDQGGCDLYMAYTADSVWSVGQSFGATINTINFEGMPCLSPDNRDLYFVSDRDGGYGGTDIWVSRFENGLWQKPRNLGAGVNTPGNETAPFIHIDNSTLYFSSNGHTGMGGSDLYYTKRVNDTDWAAPVNLGFPINTSANEASISVTMDGTKAFLSSDRDSVTGNYDLYETWLPSHLKPVPVAIVKGYVYDSLDKSRLSSSVIIIKDYYSGEQLYRYVSNRGDGSFTMTLPAGKKYLYEADRIGYQEHVDTISLIGVQMDVANPIVCEIPLLPQSYSAPIFDSLLFTIHFPINSSKLSDSDKQLIHQAIDPWLRENGVVWMINGYTDNTGTPMINETLSATRARLVADEITGYGLSEMNMDVQGWGEAAPLASNETEIGRDLNRRVEVIIRR